MAYGLLENTQQILEVVGIDMPRIRLAGGMSRSTLWSQILSDVFDTHVEVGIPESSALGAAICAGVGAKVFKDLTESAQSLVRIIRVHEPIPENRDQYQDFFADWKRLRDARLEVDKIAADLSLQAIIRTTNHLESSQVTPGFRPRILITAEVDPASLEILRTMGDVEHRSYREEMTMLTGEDMVEALGGYHVFITEIDVLDADVVQQLPDLRVVFSCRGNPVNIDINACTAYGIPVLNTPGRNADAVADLTVTLILMLARKIPLASNFLRQPGGEEGDMGRMGQAHFEFQGHELWQKTIGLIGFGAIGRKVARRLQSFGVHLLAYDPYAVLADALRVGVELVPFEELLSKSDFISLHAAITDETRGLISADQLAQMKSGAYLVNTARAALVDEGALIEALSSGHLGGAALDVFAIEPPGSDHPLLQLPNVIATPHVGGNTFEVSAHQGTMVVTDLKRMLQGDRPEHILNPETLEHFNWTAPRQSLSRDALSELEISPGPAVSDLQVEQRQVEEGQQDIAQSEKSGKLGGIFSRLRKSKEKAGDQHMMGDIADVKEQMTAIITRFLQRLSTDDGLQSFAQGKNVTMLYILTDLDLRFFTAFLDGVVQADLGEPPSKPDVTLKMKTDMLDGMFTGRTNAMRAAMTGKLAFSGDTMKGMTLQRIQKDLMRLYSEARAEVGDPGDLTRIVGIPSPIPEKSPPSPSVSVPGPTDRVRQVGDERDELFAILNELYLKGLITATGGNLSVRVSSQENELWITPSQIFKGNLRPEIMVRIDLDGNPLDPDSLTASSERFVHCAILRRRSDIRAVIHTHAPKAMTLALAELPFLPISTEAAFIGEIPRVPFIMPGTKELAETVTDALGDGVAVLMQNHGLVVVGSTLRRAADLTEVIEHTADSIVTCHAMGVEPPVLPDEVLKKLREIGKMMA
jgi:autoinducer 2 (AI-2) kinase